MALKFGGLGIAPTLRGLPSNVYTLQAGQTFAIPAGDWYVALGKYTAIQFLDPITGIWRWAGDNGQGCHKVTSDGANFRVANTTGCAVGAVITNAGTLYTSAPTVTPSGGASLWQAIIGGAVNTSVTVTAGGSGYVYPPQVSFSAPGAPGIQATGFCTLSAGAVSTVTVTDQGAGYIVAPTVTFFNDDREGQNGLGSGSGAQAVTVLTGAQTMTGLLCLDHGTPLTSVPTLAFAGGGGSAAAATVLMDFSITGYSVNVGGAAYTTTAAAGAVEVTGIGGFVTTANAYTNPTTQREILRRRRASITAPTTATAGAITATGAIVDDGGHYEAIPSVAILGGTGVITTPAQLTLAVGGLTDIFGIFAA